MNRSTLLNVDDANTYFAQIVTASGESSHSSHLSFCENQGALTMKPLTTNEVQSSILHLKTSTAAGCDKLPAFLLKQLAAEISPHITLIMNRSIESGKFPSTWKKANVTAIYKGKGSKEDPGNYRPISILPILGRTMEKMIAGQM